MLYDLLVNNPGIKYRDKIVLRAGEEGYTVSEVRDRKKKDRTKVSERCCNNRYKEKIRFDKCR